jgi:hypothetical protein
MTTSNKTRVVKNSQKMSNSKVKLTQKERIMKTLLAGGRITQAQARNRGIMSLSSRVNELRHDGVPIKSSPYINRKGYTAVQYHLG